MFCSAHLSEEDHRYWNHQHADDEITDDDWKQTQRADYGGQYGQAKVCQVRETGIHRKHARGWRSATEGYASNTKARGPSPHQCNRQGQKLTPILELTWREAEHSHE